MAKKQSSGQSAQTQLRVGRLTKAHGLKGALKLELFTDDPERRFVPGAEFALQVPTSSPWHGKRIALTELRWYNGQPVGFFEGVTDRAGAESLVKAILWVDASPDEPQEEDAWYDHQLVGLAVVREGERIGAVARVEPLPAQDLLVVKAGDREVMVPFVKAIVPSVDTVAWTGVSCSAGAACPVGASPSAGAGALVSDTMRSRSSWPCLSADRLGYLLVVR